MSVTSTAVPTARDKELADALLAGARRLRRTTRRRVRRDWPVPPLPPAQVELLQVVADRPGVGVTDAAAALSLATNTVSTLAKQLAVAGLVDRRRPGSGDRRAVHLALTPAAEERIAMWRDRRAELVAAALGSLGGQDRARLEAAVPALGRLADALEGA
ncbi:MAG TPA: MarR family winged helix-turn-helix transcriptional regulator [Acidimicrobiia bacterium]|nr:MarR family winged helix-turn-helix transcriptional regulator [Acidimicrobiia bacterium]